VRTRPRAPTGTQNLLDNGGVRKIHGRLHGAKVRTIIDQ